MRADSRSDREDIGNAQQRLLIASVELAAARSMTSVSPSHVLTCDLAHPTDPPPSTAYPDLVFAQEYLAHARTDLKVFVIGQRAFGLELFGVEIAEETRSLSVIDVNYFPGYRGVPDAAQHLVGYLLTAMRAA
jgi:inositol 1,3,4-trisphosphate 5/6-kinase